MPRFELQARRKRRRPAPRPSGHPKAYIASSTGIKLVLPYAPRSVEHSGWADTWATLSRPGREPLVVRSGDGLSQMSFEVLLARPSHQQSVEDYLSVLRKLASSPTTVAVGNMGPREAGPWVLSKVSVQSVLRQAGTNNITRAEVSLTFLRQYGSGYKTGPVTGRKPKVPPKKGAPRWVTATDSTTLSGLARKYLGDADDWPRIAKHPNNKHIRNPHVIRPGIRIYIPGT